MKFHAFALSIACAFALSALPAPASVAQSFVFTVARAPHPLPLDPALADSGWAAGLVPTGSGPWQNVTTRSPATLKTTAYLLYDDKNLYVAFKADQPGVPIVATQTTNDVGFGSDDFVGIGVDTSGSGSQVYYFETTPRGVRYEQANENARYRPRWSAAARLDQGSWSAVMIVPLNVIRVARGGKQTWRFQFVRGVAARGEHLTWVWDPIMQDSATWPVLTPDPRFWPAGQLDLGASAAMRPKPRADAFVLGGAGPDRNLVQQTNGTFVPMHTRSYGVDASVPLTPTIRFVGTLNPDFSNVEIDQQTIAPQEFQRQLVEYRPFFAQGAAYINADSTVRAPIGTNVQAPFLVFYSPSVGPFDSGAKVEGTYDGDAFGALTFHGYDPTTNNTFTDSAYGFQHAVPGGTFTYWSDGLFANHSIAGWDNTIEGGVEARNLNNGMIYVGDYSFEDGSWVPQGHAHLGELFIDRHKGNTEFGLSYLDVSPNYNPIDGYTPNSDIRGLQFFANYAGATPAIKNYTIFVAGDRFLDDSGAVHQADSQLFVNAVFKNQFSLDGWGSAVGQLRSYGIPAGPGCGGPILFTSSFTGYPCYRDGVTAPYNLYQLPVGYRDGTPSPIDVNYSWGPFGPNYVHLFTIVTSRPLARGLSLGLEYDGTYQRSFSTGVLDSQWLRRVSLGYNVSSESTLSVGLRDINGRGGFATQIGNNLAVAFHERFRTGNEIFINYGSPAAGATLNRLIVKYVFHAGADAGT
ncbi:MAG: hypothetical protein JO311_02930 [Candidatus Eremiobacteraeota bacterium]|nr:hypothetical protein [Candidatus Eremiobacteraeota bacterium]MBV9264089.1 hypothetical protein [Candidatus Eremiobacteraeota bacterium]